MHSYGVVISADIMVSDLYSNQDSRGSELENPDDLSAFRAENKYI